MKKIAILLTIIPSMLGVCCSQEFLERSDNAGLINGVAWDSNMYKNFGARIIQPNEVRLIVLRSSERATWMVVFRENIKADSGVSEVNYFLDIFKEEQKKHTTIKIDRDDWVALVKSGRELIVSAKAAVIFDSDEFIEDDYRLFCGFDATQSPVGGRALSGRAGDYKKDSKIGIIMERIKEIAAIR